MLTYIIQVTVLQPPGLATPTQLGGGSNMRLGAQSDISGLGGPGVAIPASLGQATSVANIPPPGLLAANITLNKPLPKGKQVFMDRILDTFSNICCSKFSVI